MEGINHGQFTKEETYTSKKASTVAATQAVSVDTFKRVQHDCQTPGQLEKATNNVRVNEPCREEER